MPSQNQNNTQSTEWASEAGRFIESDVDPLPMIRGIRKRERALEWHREAHKHNAPKAVKEAIATRLRELD